MRNSFAKAVYELAAQDDDFVVVVADISPAGAIDSFRTNFPNRFINVGVAEQSMIGIAAGIALTGKRVICYTIAPFALYRPFEFIKLDLAYQSLPVMVVGMGAGLAYPTLGPTHHTIEDLAVAKCISGLDIVTPSDPGEVYESLKNFIQSDNVRPAYLRLGKAGEPTFRDVSSPFDADGIRCLHKTNGAKAILTYGPIVKLVMQEVNSVHDPFSDHVPSVFVIKRHRPVPETAFDELLRLYDKMLVVEEHIQYGGIYDDLCRYSKNNSLGSTNLRSVALKHSPVKEVGTYEDLLKFAGFDFHHLQEFIRDGAHS